MRVSQRKLTVPNALTIARAVAIPWLFLLIRDNPGANWWIAGLFAVSDNVDGALARLGDKHTRLRQLGFRRSEPGRKLDPVVDKLFIAAILVAGMLHGAIPLWLGTASLVQKAVVAGISVIAQRRGQNLQVSKTGKYAEFMTICGFGLLLMAEAIQTAVVRQSLRGGAIVLAATGIVIAVKATLSYAGSSGRKGQV